MEKDQKIFEKLSAEQKGLVAVAVLLDGHESETYLSHDLEQGELLSKAATEVASQPADLRMPFLGSVLRSVIRELNR